jgi:hypothetical protein
MGYGLRRSKIEGGSGGKRGHSNMTDWEYTEQIKRRSRKARRRVAKTMERQAKQMREELDYVGTSLVYKRLGN